ncbi:MAG: hypothetical protein ABF976_04365 [Acetobacter syzygii]|uniref:hypothetical protein n=1 Tax=Acetobacter syzygii TaxID=146476 RepID=UPI0039ED8AD2
MDNVNLGKSASNKTDVSKTDEFPLPQPQFLPEFAENLPPSCPPEEAVTPAQREVWRFIPHEKLEELEEKDFFSYAALKKNHLIHIMYALADGVRALSFRRRRL